MSDVGGKMFSVEFPDVKLALPIMRRMVARIFAQGGPDGATWPVRKSDGGMAFNGGARFLSTLAEETTPYSAALTMGNGLPDVFAHQYGVTFHHPGSSKLQVFTGKDGSTVFTRFTKDHDITIPARPLMAWMRPEMEDIMAALGRSALKFIDAEATTNG